VGWIKDLLGTLAPELATSLRSGVSAFRSRRRKELHRFVLKAMATEPGRLLARTPGTMRYDLATIDRRVYIAQMEEALGEVPLFHDEPIPPDKENQYKAALERHRKLGLSAPNDPARLKRLEEILNEMVDDNRLAFHPPNAWMVK
jgi:hypothetical protein